MVDVQLIFGPMLIGVCLNMILFGVLVVQMFTYYQTYKKDSRWIKYLVFYLFIAETINTGLNMGMMYEPLIIRFGTLEATKFFPLMLSAEPVMIVAISTPIQLFIAWRILKLSKSIWIPAVICALAAASLAGGIWTTTEIAIIRTFARKPELHTPALLWLVTAAGADILITFSLSRSLYVRKTGYAQTDAVITRIIALTIQTGLVTAIAALGDVIFFLVLPRTTLNFIWDLVLTKLYSNTLMSTLNARASWNSSLSVKQGNTIFSDPDAHNGENSKNPQIINPLTQSRHDAIYELEARKSYAHDGSFEDGVEYSFGISVTKIVERSD